MESPISKPPGTPALELDTPSLVVDLDALDHNLAVVHGFFRRLGSRLRPQVHVHKTPEIARRQLAVAGAARGVAVVSLSEAEAFADAGCDDILITLQLVTPSKMARACGLARTVRLSLVSDNPETVKLLSEAATSAGVTLDVLVDVQTHPSRPGVAPGRPAVTLARQVAVAQGLRFAGFSSASGPLIEPDMEAFRFRDWTAVQLLLDTRRRAEQSSLDVAAVSFGDGTYVYDVAGKAAGVTEVRAGAYALLDANSAPHCPALKPAAKVLTTVSSRPEPGRGILDCGQKAVSKDFGLPAVEGREDLAVVGLNAEHGTVHVSDGHSLDLGIGDKLWLVPADVSAAFALHDVVYAVRRGVVEEVWPVSARGRFD